MREQPAVDDLLQSVIEFLRSSAVPRLSGQPALYARISANVLETVRRELALVDSYEAAERSRLHALLASDEQSLASLNRRLCELIRAGEMGLDTPGLVDHLWQTAIDKVAIDQPTYSTYQRVRGAAPGGTV